MEVETKNIDVELSDLKIGDELYFSDYFWDGTLSCRSEYKKGYSKVVKIYRVETIVDGIIDTYFYEPVYAKLENDITIHLGFYIDGVFKEKNNE